MLVMCVMQAGSTSSPVEMVTEILMETAKAVGTVPKMGRSPRSPSLNELERFSVDDYLQCENLANTAKCQGSLQQQLYSIALQCGQEELAMSLRRACSVNENGYHCEILPFLQLNYTEETVECFTNFAGSCNPGCKSNILSVHRELGCCSKDLTDRFFNDFTIFSGFIWRVCEVAPGPVCEVPIINVTSPSPLEEPCNATGVETRVRLLEHLCTYPNSQDILDAYTESVEPNCSSLIQSTVEACGVDETGDLCLSKSGSDLVSTVVQECSGSLFGGSCGAGCTAALNNIRTSLGCCLNNIYNLTLARIIPNPTYQQILPFWSFNLWSKCGVEPLGVCESRYVMPPCPPWPLTTAPTPATTPTPTPTTTHMPITTHSLVTTSDSASVVGSGASGVALLSTTSVLLLVTLCL